MTQHHGVVHFELPAEDPQKLADFYTELFGWNIMKMPMDGGAPAYAAAVSQAVGGEGFRDLPVLPEAILKRVLGGGGGR